MVDGAGCTGAVIALKHVVAEQKIPGTIRLFGCAAEGARVYDENTSMGFSTDADDVSWNTST